MAIDTELVKQIHAAEQPRHFLFVTGTTNHLKLGRSKPTTDDEKEVKQAAGGAPKVFKGRAVMEKVNDEETLVFYLGSPDKALEPKLKRAIKESAGINKAVEVRALADFKDPDGQPGGQPQGGQPQQPQGGHDADPFKAEYGEMAADVKDEIAALKKTKPDIAAKLEPKLKEIENSVKGNMGYKAAVKELAKLQKVAEKGLGKTTSDQKAVAEKAAYKSLRDRLAVAVQTLRLANPGVAGKLDQFIADAEAMVAQDLPEDERNYKTATKVLLKLEAFLAKTMPKTPEPTDPNVKKQIKEAQKAPAEYETAYRECRNFVKNLSKVYPQSPRLKNYNDRIAVAAGQARIYQFDKALPAIKAVHMEITAVAEEYRQYAKKRDSYDTVLKDVLTAKQPQFAPNRIKHFRDLRSNVDRFAQEFTFDTASKGIVALEEEIRLALAERQTFVEAYRETAKLLNDAEAKFGGNDQKFQGWESEFLEAADLFETGNGSPAEAYDRITKVGTAIRQALRSGDVKQESGQKVTEMTEGTSREARRFRFQLDLDGARKALLVIGNHDPEIAQKLGERLAEVTKARKKSLTEAEKQFGPLQKDIQAALAFVRKGMKEGDWDYPEDEAKVPPPNLEEWSNDIDQNQVLSKVKVGKKLGGGGFGSVYRLDPNDQHLDDDLPPLVVKIPPEGTSKDEEAKKMALGELHKEAGIYEQIGDHPNILKCLGMRKVGGSEGLVMEAVRGKTADEFFANLRARVAEGKLSEPEFWSTVQYTIGKIMGALAHMHQKGLAHNDLKQQNVMIDEVSGDVKVIDVGTANPLGEVVKGVDNPIFQAPEQLKKEGSSGQTDALPVGGIAYTGVTGQESFHFGNKAGMMAAFMSDIEKVMETYGELRGEGAEDKAIGQAPEGEVVRTVNRRGEDDPEGNILLRDPSKSSARSAWTEFMNGIMHADPAKRLSPQQAMEHPFLRDMMIPEEQVRAIIQSGSEDKILPGQEPEREHLGNLKGNIPIWEGTLKELQEAVKVEPDKVAPEQLLAGREAIAKHLESLDDARVNILKRIDVLTGLIANARQKDTEVYFEDNRDLDALRKLAKGLDKLRPDAVRILRTFNTMISRSTEALGDNVTVEQVEQRVQALQQSRVTLAAEIEKAINNPVPTLFGQCQNLDRLQAQLETIQANTAIERHYVFKLAKPQPTPPQLKTLTQHLTDHLKELAPIVADIRKAREDATKHADYLNQQVTDNLLPEYQSLLKTFKDESEAHDKAGAEFQKLVRAPRDTQEAIAAYEDARLNFESAEERYQTRLAEFRQTLATQQARVLDYQKQLGKKAAPGVTNPLKTLSRLYKDLNKLKAKINR